MSNIRSAVDVEGPNNIRRAVIFGIGMLETLPMFKGNALHFLQVLLAYFKSKKVCIILVDWALSKSTDNKPLRQTEFARHLVASELTVRSKKGRTELQITRRNYRSFRDKVGFLEIKDNTLVIGE